MTDQERLDYIDSLERLVAFFSAGREDALGPDGEDEPDEEDHDPEET